MYSQNNCSPQIFENGFQLGESEYVCNIGDCLDLNIDVTNVKTTNSYVVNSISFNPPISFDAPLEHRVVVLSDDVWSNIVNFRGPRDVNNNGTIETSEQNVSYNFCFFGNIYTSAIIGSNGIISFDTSDANGANAWEIPNGASLPSRTQGAWNDGNIFGADHDMDFGIGNNTNYLTWQIFGEYPCRYLVVMYKDVPHYSPGSNTSCHSLKTTQMIVMYENTNIIEVYIKNKPRCTIWNPTNNGGNAVIGIQNDAGTIAYTPPGRNNFQLHIQNEAWQFAPNGNYSPEVEWFESTNGGAFQSLGNGLNKQVCLNEPKDIKVQVTYNTCDEAFIVSDEVHLAPLDIQLPSILDAGCVEGTYTLSVNSYDNVTYQWYFNNSAITGANTASYEAYDPGDYRVEVNYTSTSGSRVCNYTATTQLSIQHAPEAQDVQEQFCDDDNSGSNLLDLTSYENQINNTTGLTFLYFNNLTDLANNTNALTPTTYNALVGTNTVYVRVQDATNCYSIAEITIVIEAPPNAGADSEIILCGNDEVIDLFSLLGSDADVGGTWTPALTSGTGLFNPMIDEEGTYTYTVFGEECPDDSSQVLVEINSTPISNVLEDIFICANSEATLDAGAGFSSYQWYYEGNPIIGANQSTYTTNVIGNYSVELIQNYPNGVSCINVQEANVGYSDIPYIADVEYGNGYIRLIGAGSVPPYSYSLNGGDYQFNDTFYLPPGVYTFGINSSTQCEGYTVEIPVIFIPNAITPNSDGINDVWNLKGIDYLDSPSLDLFDRFGKKIVQFNSESIYKWDGKYLGRNLPSTTYWYVLKFKSFNGTPKILNGYLLIKNRNSTN